MNAKGLTLHIGQRCLLKDVSFALARGSITALIGPNGSGKSSLLKTMAGLLDGEGGLEFEGQSVFSLTAAARAKIVGYLGHELHPEFPITAREVLSLGVGKCAGDPLVELGIENLADRDFSTLSSGERQLVGLAWLMRRDPEVWLLDESLSKIDANYILRAQAILAAKAARGGVVVIVAHDFRVALEGATHAMLMREGRLLSSATIESALRPELLTQVYPGQALRLTASPSGWRLELDRGR